MKKYIAKFSNASIQKKFNKELSGLPQNLQDQVWEAIARLEENPRPFSEKMFTQIKPPLRVYDFVACYRLRIGNFRVLYDVDDHKAVIWIFALRRRNEGTYR